MFQPEGSAMARQAIRVLLADDHPLMLGGIRSLLAEYPDIEIAGEASDGVEALRMATNLHPDVVVLDMSMPGMNGVAVARRLRDAGSLSKVIALTVHQEPAYLRQLLEVGMGGYVLKRSAANDLAHAIRIVAAGGVYFDPAIAGQIVKTTIRRVQATVPIGSVFLSDREVEVLRLTALGHSNKAIADELTIAVKTVETYKARAMEKLGFRGRVDLIRYAMGKGWLNDC
jgi:DNA-binding NarL/FixJ family response regulator